jgi:AraC family ethanolamine operon transcriptional activator
MPVTSSIHPIDLHQKTTDRTSTPQISITQSHDADEHAHNLTDWAQSYDQITNGTFYGVLTELKMPQMQIFCEHTSQALRQSCCVWPQAFWFGIPSQTNTQSLLKTDKVRLNGRQSDSDAIMVRPGDCEFELLTPANYTVYGIVVKADSLKAAASRMDCRIDWQKLATTEVLHVSDANRQACLQLLGQLTSQKSEPVEKNSGLADVSDDEETAMMAVLTMLDTGEVDRAISNSFMRRRRIVAQARDYALGHKDQLINVTELCECLHVSRRTLQYCFEDVLGMSPTQYLRIIRLNGARRELREPVSKARMVGDVAADWGFGHLSQFANDYRKLFGQTPSACLRQRPR